MIVLFRVSPLAPSQGIFEMHVLFHRAACTSSFITPLERPAAPVDRDSPPGNSFPVLPGICPAALSSVF